MQDEEGFVPSSPDAFVVTSSTVTAVFGPFESREAAQEWAAAQYGEHWITVPLTAPMHRPLEGGGWQ